MRPENPFPHGVVTTPLKAEAKTTFIVYGDDVLECELYGQGTDKIPWYVDIMCPRCGNPLVIDGQQKEIEVEFYDREKLFRFPNGEYLQVTNRVSIKQPIMCSWDSKSGKGICGWRVKVTNGHACKVGF